MKPMLYIVAQGRFGRVSSSLKNTTLVISMAAILQTENMKASPRPLLAGVARMSTSTFLIAPYDLMQDEAFLYNFLQFLQRVAKSCMPG